jgi:hypothetical protein
MSTTLYKKKKRNYYACSKVMFARFPKPGIVDLGTKEMLARYSTSKFQFSLLTKGMFTTFLKPGLIDFETNPMFPRCSKPRFLDFGTVVMFTTFIKNLISGAESKIYSLEVLKTRISGLWTRSNVYDLVLVQK